MKEQLKIAAVVVLYDESLEESETYKSLLAEIDWPVLIYDNSPEPQVIIDHKGLTYMHDPTNPGVSGAYNRAISWANDMSASHILLLDSDSVFPEGAKEVYEEYVLRFPEDILLPSLYSKTKRISPFFFHSGKTFYGDGIAYGEISLGRILAINSGSLMPLGSLGDIRYDETLPLDWSDIQFFRTLSSTSLKAQHIPLEVQHGLSEHSIRELASAQFRFSLYMSGIATVADGWSEHMMMLFWAKMKAIKLCLTYRTIWFGAEFLRKFYA